MALLISNTVLWLLVTALSITVLALARQVGILHERIAPAGALMVGSGHKVGEKVPVVEVMDIHDNSLSIGGIRADLRSTLLFFLSPTCPVCKTLLPALKSIQKSENDWLETVFASDGDSAEHEAFVDEHGLSGFPYVLSTRLGLTYHVGKLPYAVLIDREGVLRAKGLVNSREHIESLFEASELGVASIQEYLSNSNGNDSLPQIVNRH